MARPDRIRNPRDLAALERSKAEAERQATVNICLRARAEAGSWRTVGGYGPDGLEPQFEEGWTHDPETAPVQFRREAGWVELRGLALSTVPTTSLSIFYLPVGYRPAEETDGFDVPTTYLDESTPPGTEQVIAIEDGLVFLFGATGGPVASLNLDGVTFPAA